MNPRLFHFTGGDAGAWRVTRITTLCGDPLPEVARLDLSADPPATPGTARWILQGVVSNERYVTRPEKNELAARQEGLNRPAAVRGALIPIRKNAAWWALTQDERRALLEDASRHIAIGLRYLPAIARRLHHCRDLAEPQPFDFVTWFEFAPEHEASFDALLAELRASEEWKYVDREIDFRLSR